MSVRWHRNVHEMEFNPLEMSGGLRGLRVEELRADWALLGAFFEILEL